jgi:hypothetical protein
MFKPKTEPDFIKLHAKVISFFGTEEVICVALLIFIGRSPSSSKLGHVFSLWKRSISVVESREECAGKVSGNDE